MDEWRRTRQERGRQTLRGAIRIASSPADDSACRELEEGATVVEEILFLADLRSVDVKQLLTNRLARERQESYGMQAIGALAELGEFPADIDPQLGRWAAARNLTVEELLQVLLDELS